MVLLCYDFLLGWHSVDWVLKYCFVLVLFSSCGLLNRIVDWVLNRIVLVSSSQDVILTRLTVFLCLFLSFLLLFFLPADAVLICWCGFLLLLLTFRLSSVAPGVVFICPPELPRSRRVWKQYEEDALLSILEEVVVKKLRCDNGCFKPRTMAQFEAAINLKCPNANIKLFHILRPK
ncbi:hypothetical protein DVH24_028147 [Malus domestica]|uniref:Uncharacterized protein n=1 Tax=Malus domestica TaxID=3750 RepID=A0A498HAZ4_MALDO|nr:hypothetical protein DVH24_028147 [Malus domestica]